MPSNYRPLTGKSKRSRATQVETAGKLLTIFSAGFFLISILCSFSSPSNTKLHRPSFLSKHCDPFSLPGYVDAHSSWRPFDPSCSSNLLSSLLSKAEVPELSFLHNRTVLLIGDHQVDRTLVQQFCSLTGHKTEAVTRQHPWGESLAKVTTKDDLPLSHFCYLPEYDFVLSSVYNFGADTTEFWRDERVYAAPGRFEERLQRLWVPMMQSMTSFEHTSPALPRPRKSSIPDLLVFNSGFWDLAKWALEDVKAGTGLLENLSESRILSWRSRMVDILSSLHNQWPSTRIAWRNTHYPLASEATTVEWFLGIETTEAKKNHPLYHANRISQLNNAQASVLHPNGDDLVKGEINRAARLPKNVVGAPWAEMTLGQDQKQLDPLNPSLKPGGMLFAELMLWNLREAL